MDGALYLEDGSLFLGKIFGYPTQTSGEVVFSTGMVGYPQSLTDPSYEGQILVFTYPLIGNYGVPQKKYKNKILQNFESEKIQVKGLVVNEKVDDQSHWQARQTLDCWLKQEKIVGLWGIDTRALTQKLREKGVMLGKLGRFKIDDLRLKNGQFYDPNKENLVAKVSCKKPIIYKNGPKKVLLIDCGVKMGIVRKLFALGLTIIRVPWDFDLVQTRWSKTTGFSYQDIDGVVISNGPGDPRLLSQTIKTVKKILGKKIPTLGICLGNQLMGLAAGGSIYKLKYGHRSVNQPVLLIGSKKAFITSQNHGFAVDKKSLNSDWQEWFINLNDETNEGIRHKYLPFMSIQFHPEGNPGPQDTSWIFEEFISLL